MISNREVKISLSALASPFYPVMVSPVAAMVLSGYLKKVFKNAIDIVVHYFQVEPIYKIVEAINRERPDIIGFSLQAGSEEQIDEAMRGVMSVVSTWQAQPLIVFGNVLATFAAKILLEKYPEILMVIGEGEYALEGIVKKVLAGKNDFATIPNLIYKVKGKIVETNRCVFDLNKISMLSFDYVKEVSKRQGHIWIESSRGCSFRCTFCSRYSVRMSKWSPIAPNKVIEEIAQLHAKFGVNHFRFTDDDFMGTGSADGVFHAEEIA